MGHIPMRRMTGKMLNRASGLPRPNLRESACRVLLNCIQNLPSKDVVSFGDRACSVVKPDSRSPMPGKRRSPAFINSNPDHAGHLWLGDNDAWNSLPTGIRDQGGLIVCSKLTTSAGRRGSEKRRSDAKESFRVVSNAGVIAWLDGVSTEAVKSLVEWSNRGECSWL